MFNYSARKILAEEEVDNLRARSTTYTEPLPDNDPIVKIFLRDFYEKDIFEKGIEFKAELMNYPDSVGEHYKFLVPDMVSFDAFFSRYFYRCNIQTVMREMQKDETIKSPRMPSRSKSNDPLVPLAETSSSHHKRRVGGSGNRRPEIQRTKSTDHTPMFSKEKSTPTSLAEIHREERNEMAFKLLQEARGFDGENISPHQYD